MENKKVAIANVPANLTKSEKEFLEYTINERDKISQLEVARYFLNSIANFSENGGKLKETIKKMEKDMEELKSQLEEGVKKNEKKLLNQEEKNKEEREKIEALLGGLVKIIIEKKYPSV